MENGGVVHEDGALRHLRHLATQDDNRAGVQREVAVPRIWAEVAWNPRDDGIHEEAGVVDPSTNAAADDAYRRIGHHLTKVVAGPTSDAVVEAGDRMFVRRQ